MRERRGFTLIEMLIVVAVVGLLSSVVVVGLSGARTKARDARRVSDIRLIQNELEIAYTDVIGYPAPVTCGSVTGAPGCPKDPQGRVYRYEHGANNFTYKLGITLEGTENNNHPSGICPANVTAPAFCVTPQ